MKRTIKLRESELKRMIAESVKRVLNEGNGHDPLQVYFKITEHIRMVKDLVQDLYNASEGSGNSEWLGIATTIDNGLDAIEEKLELKEYDNETNTRFSRGIRKFNQVQGEYA